MTFWEFVALFISGGAVGFGLTAWIGWDIKKRELRLQQRRQQVEKWRALIAKFPDQGGWSGGGAREREFITSQEFASLEPHLDKDLLKKLRSERAMVVGHDFPRRALSEVIAKLEKQWKLI
jgi:hypothetical protein